MVDVSKIMTDSLVTVLNSLTSAKSFAFASASWILLFVHSRDIFILPSSVVTIVFICAILFSCLFLTNTMAYLFPILKTKASIFSDKQKIKKEIKFLTSKEKRIIAYLLHHNRKMIEVLPDGEEAATLISKGFLILPSVMPPSVHRDIQFVIPEYVWKIVSRKKDVFKYQPIMNGKTEVQPWRTDWMVR